MSLFKCKMCGGTLEFAPGDTVATCEYCGTRQTLPRLDDDKRANLYDRAGHFRRNNEFDKAAGIYEQILSEDNTDAEAYWSLVLCRYGIEYVEDPQTHKRIPTVNRAQYTSIFDDEDYKSAIANADAAQREVYETEAKTINEIQKGILAISQKEEPFDVFICYKETDANGRRTPDSVLANDLYHQLTGEGFKVFFARITLEDKLGSAYEPYIFAALNSAKVMVVLGTKPAYFNAVWVKNEWSRYLALIKSGAKKILIPAYKDMDPYDLPEEFSHLQAQDMSKLGFMQDLIRGIKKLTGSDAPKARTVVKETVVTGANASTVPLLKRAFMFLEDGNWQEADAYCEKVLDQDPECAEAYLGKLMADRNVKKQEDLADLAEPFDGNNNYQKAVRFGNEKLASMLKGYIDHINERNEEARLADIYKRAMDLMKFEWISDHYSHAAELFRSIPGYKDADALAEQCAEKVETAYMEGIYGRAQNEWKIGNYEAAIDAFKSITGFRDADEQQRLCERAYAEKQAADEAHAKKRKKAFAIGTLVVCVCIAFVIVLTNIIIPKQKLNKAMSLLDSGDYDSAYALLEEIGNSEAIASSKYDRAVKLIDSGDYEPAYMLLRGFDYKDGADKAKSIYDEYIVEKIKTAKEGDYVFFGAYEQDNNSSNGKESIEWLVLAKRGNKTLVISKYALDCQWYNASCTNVTWETCTLQKWLNGTFLNAAFSSEEQNSIISSTVTAEKNPSYSTSPGNNTTDKVFLLSITEVNKYFSSDEARKCAPTDYAKAQGAYTSSSYSTGGKATCGWWLRSPGYFFNRAAAVLDDGSIYKYGDYVNFSYDAGVRPALWINLES